MIIFKNGDEVRCGVDTVTIFNYGTKIRFVIVLKDVMDLVKFKVDDLVEIVYNINNTSGIFNGKIKVIHGKIICEWLLPLLLHIKNIKIQR